MRTILQNSIIATLFWHQFILYSVSSLGFNPGSHYSSDYFTKYSNKRTNYSRSDDFFIHDEGEEKYFVKSDDFESDEIFKNTEKMRDMKKHFKVSDFSSSPDSDGEYVANDRQFGEDVMDSLRKDPSQAGQFQEHFKEFQYERNMQFQDSTCAQSELYANSFVQGAGYNWKSIQVKDLEIRKTDRSVFMTGIYNDDTWWGGNIYTSCFMLRVNYLGTYENSAYLYHGVSPTQLYTQCYAITITEDNHIVAVGQYYNGYITYGANPKYAGLIIYSDDRFANQIVRFWSESLNIPSASYYQVANDVAVTSDGSIYVTGTLSGWAVDPLSGQYNGYDCYVLRLDTNLNMVYAKSFGDSYDQYCTSIQVSRNQDYIYIGGQQTYQVVGGLTYQQLIFFKLSNGFADYILFNSFAKSTTAVQLNLRRIILPDLSQGSSQPIVYGSTDDVVYFCASYWDGTQYDFVFGQLDNSLTLQYIYKYGHPTDNDQMGDCAITRDGRYLIGTFGTASGQNTGGATITSGNNPTDEYIYPFLVYTDITTPFGAVDPCFVINPCCCGCCTCCNSACGCLPCGGLCGCCNPNCATNGCCSFCCCTPCCVSVDTNPFFCNPANGQCSKCYYQGFYLTWNQLFTCCGNVKYDAITLDCETRLSTAIHNYLNVYNTQAYTWHTCRHYTFDMSNVHCWLTDMQFPYCSASTVYDFDCDGQGGQHDGGNTHWCNTAGFQQQINDNQPYFYHYNGGNMEFASNTIESFLCNTGIFANWEWMPYFFCDSNGAVPNRWDNFYFVFEQDCLSPINWDFFIFKVNLHQISSGTRSNANMNDYQTPLNAVYFGEYDYDEFPYAIGVDEYGFIVVAGTTNAPSFGVPGNCIGMLYVKTHWDLNYELNNGNAINWFASPQAHSGALTFLKKRFVTPKKFTNKYVDNGIGISTGYTFLYELFTAGTIIIGNLFTAPTQAQTYVFTSQDQMNIWWLPQQINEKTSQSNYFTYNQNLNTLMGVATNQQYGIGQISISLPYGQNLQKNVKYQWNLPNACFNREYIGKSRFFNTGILGGQIVATNGTVTDNNVPPLATATITSPEGVYYWDNYLVASASLSISCNYALGGWPYYFCPYTDHDQWQDYHSLESLRRFQFAVRLKMVVDDPLIVPPYVKTNIPDITPTAGQIYSYQITIASYFSTGCSYLKAKQGKSANAPAGYTGIEMLPPWIMFFELNTTFLIYPPNVYATLPNPINVTVDLYCCNSLDQCASNTFTVTPIDTIPVLWSFTTSPYIIQYDTATNVGQHFTWARTFTQFSDADQNPQAPLTVSATDYYEHQNHGVLLVYTGAIIGLTQVIMIGEIFGQVMLLSPFGLNNVPFAYSDLYSFSTSFSTFELIMNRMPSFTTTGTNYAFATYDPSLQIVQNLTVINGNFPWLQQGPIQLLYLDTTSWFVDLDGDKLTYSITYSDGTQLPSWLYFDMRSGELQSINYVDASSEYMNIRITAYDTKQGFYSYYKTLLVDTAPRVINAIITIYASAGKPFSYYFGNDFMDPNGDQLSYSLSATDITKLKGYGLTFYSPTCVIQGQVQGQQFISNIQLTATDTYGLTATLYFNIIVLPSNPTVLQARNNIPDFTISTNQPFFFILPNSFFYDPYNGTALILQASSLNLGQLPSWLHFNPISRSFSGTPPSGGTVQKVEITAMNPITQDINTITFNIIVKPNNYPKTNVKYQSPDYTIFAQTWFENTISPALFSDLESNWNGKMTAQGGNGQDLASWLKFNAINRTVYGWATEPGTYRVDFAYTDDAGAQAFTNIKITVITRPLMSFPLKSQYAVAASAAMGLSIYLIFALQFQGSLLSQTKQKQKSNKKSAQEAKKRFGAYKEVDMKFYLPNSFDTSQNKPPVVTHDFDFLGIDHLAKIGGGGRK